MSRRLVFACSLVGIAALAGAAATDKSEEPAEWVLVEDIASRQPAAAADKSEESAEYAVELSIKRDGETVFAPKVAFPLGEQAKFHDVTQRPFVVGIDAKGTPVVKVFEEGVTADLTAYEGRDGVVTLDATIGISEIATVGKKGAVQTVRADTRQTRVVEPVSLGDRIVVPVSDGIEITAVVRKVD